MTTDLNQAVSNVRRYMDAALSVGHTASQYRLTDGSLSFLFHGDLDVILAALSTPPADEIREALLAVRDEIVRNGGKADAACLATLEIIAARAEVRPRGTVVPPADDVRDLLIEAIDGCIPDDIPGYRQRYTDKAADAILAAFEVRPRGTVTDAEVEAAAQTMFEDPLTPGDGYTWAEMVAEDQSRADIWRADARRVLEAAREVRS